MRKIIYSKLSVVFVVTAFFLVSPMSLSAKSNEDTKNLKVMHVNDLSEISDELLKKYPSISWTTTTKTETVKDAEGNTRTTTVTSSSLTINFW